MKFNIELKCISQLSTLVYVAYIDSLLLLKTTPFFSKTRTLTLKKDPFFKNQGPVKYTQKHHVGPIISHGEWGAGWGARNVPGKSLISGLSSLLLTIVRPANISSITIGTGVQ